ncbi:MAG: haloacid dehalogenase-like hydrolase [Bacteroidetes bacterium]|nr:MAG: haloacid dehalogenase-like hydrolase [Bacteroidota bacterium]
MNKTTFLFAFIAVTALLFSSCTQPEENKAIQTDPLPSWNDGTTKESITNFVQSVTKPGSDYFIDIPDRIAVFDNDGNLWSERPVYFQLIFAMDRVKELSPLHPEWASEQPFKAVLENDMEELMKYGEHGLLQIVMATHAGNTTDEFEAAVKDWLAAAKHPRFKRPFTDLVYQPMLELLTYLQKNDFKTFIVSGGGIEFMRPWVEEIYGIPRDQVVGSSIKTVFEIIDGKPVIKRLPEMNFIDDKEGKPVGIHKFIGRKPVFCSGNSDGDLQMMQWTASGEGSRFMLYLHHTDSIREWAYDRNSSIGKLDKGLDEAKENGWTVINMKDDWKVIYPFELQE